MGSRRGLIFILCVSVIAAIVAGILALDPILIHGFAPACSDGYAEANGTAPCTPQWGDATPYLVLLGIAIVGAAVSTESLIRGRGSRWEANASRTW